MGTIVKSHLACTACDSSDAMAIYEDDKGGQYWKCFSCEGGGQLTDKVQGIIDAPEGAVETFDGTMRAIPERDLTADTARHYRVSRNGDVLRFEYPVGVKFRRLSEKKFWAGDVPPSGLFGQDKFPQGGRYCTVTEGEPDAMAVYQMFGNKYAAVSVRNASAALEDCKLAYEWLDTFDCIVVCFDNDLAGQRAAVKVAELFAGKSKIVKMTKFKDANEYLMNGAVKEFTDAWWAAEKYTPEGIVNAADLLHELLEPRPKQLLSYPFEGLNRLTYGIRPQELVVVTAGSGIGKSQFLREIVWHALQKTEMDVGVFFLEEHRKRTAEAFTSMEAGKPLHLCSDYTAEEYSDWFQRALGHRRLHIFDSFAYSDLDGIMAKMRHMVKAQGCKLLILDHISLMVSGQTQGDERKALDEIMTKLRMFVQETGTALIAVSHLKRPEGKGHEEGAVTSLAQLRGSGSIGQLSDMVIGLERDGQATDPIVRNTTRIRVLKNRFSGLTGPCAEALYNPENGRMIDRQEEAL